MVTIAGNLSDTPQWKAFYTSCTIISHIHEKGDSMTGENIERLQDAWFFLRDAAEETGSAEVRDIMDKLHDLIDRELEKAVKAYWGN